MRPTDEIQARGGGSTSRPPRRSGSAFHQALLASGAPIGEINTLRKHFSAVKGGRLAMAAPDSTKVSLLLPDVPLRSLDVRQGGNES